MGVCVCVCEKEREREGERGREREMGIMITFLCNDEALHKILVIRYMRERRPAQIIRDSLLPHFRHFTCLQWFEIGDNSH